MSSADSSGWKSNGEMGEIVMARWKGNKGDLERFVAKFQIDSNSGCWVWNAAHSQKGYGTFWLDNKLIGAHRAAYLLYVGPIPVGLKVLHHCDNPPCVNPRHLFTGNAKDNTQDAIAKHRFDYVNARLTKATVHAIYNATGLQKEIAQRFRVEQSVVSRIKTGRLYAYMTGAALRTGRNKRLNEHTVEQVRSAVGSLRYLERRFGISRYLVKKIKQ